MATVYLAIPIVASGSLWRLHGALLNGMAGQRLRRQECVGQAKAQLAQQHGFAQDGHWHKAAAH